MYLGSQIQACAHIFVTGQMAKRKRTSKLAARVATALQVNEAANTKTTEENLNQEEEQQGNGASTHSDVLGCNTETQGTNLWHKKIGYW